MDSDSVTALLLAFDCVDQGAGIDPKLHVQVDSRLNEAFAVDTDPERRQLLAGVLLTSELRQRIRIGDTTAVCRNPISERIYALCQGMATLKAALGSREPINGVWGCDALHFVDWANRVTSNGPTYRLPRRTEIEHPAVQDILAECAINAVWLAPREGRHPELWVRPLTGHPHQIDSDDLQKHVRSDFDNYILLRGHKSDDTLIQFARFHARPDEDRFPQNGRDSVTMWTPRSDEVSIQSFLAECHVLEVSSTVSSGLAGGIIGRFSNSEQSYLVPPETLAQLVRETCNTIKSQRSITLHHGTDLYRVVDELQEIGQDILTLRKHISQAVATRARIGALCLAAATNDQALQYAFRKIAAGITIIELRQQKIIPTAEAIVLANG